MINSLTVFTFILLSMSSIVYFILFYFIIIRHEKRRHLTYPMYKARDDLVGSVLEGKIDKDDTAFNIVYDLINNSLRNYKQITLWRLISNSIIINANNELLKEIERRKQIIISADDCLKQPFIDFLKAVLVMICKTSIFLQFLIKVGPILRRYFSFSEHPKYSPRIYKSYSEINQYTDQLCSV